MQSIRPWALRMRINAAFNKDIFIPYVTRTMKSVTLYVNCPKSGSVATALAGEYKKSLKVLNDLDAGRCH
jgi:hypothetical protein